MRSSADLDALQTSLGAAPIDVLIHSAGVYRNTPRDVIMEVNAKLRFESPRRCSTTWAASQQRKIGILTSQMGARRGRTGSLGDYGDSKAALNDAFRKQAPLWRDRGILAVVIHPGWVQTDMGGSSASISVAESATGIRNLMNQLTSDMHGRFWTWDQREHDW